MAKGDKQNRYTDEERLLSAQALREFNVGTAKDLLKLPAQFISSVKYDVRNGRICPFTGRRLSPVDGKEYPDNALWLSVKPLSEVYGANPPLESSGLKLYRLMKDYPLDGVVVDPEVVKVPDTESGVVVITTPVVEQPEQSDNLLKCMAANTKLKEENAKLKQIIDTAKLILS